VVLFFVAAGLCLLIISGVLAGRRAKFGGLLLGCFSWPTWAGPICRTSLLDYKQKYDIDPNHSAQSTQPVLNFLRDKYYEHRVTELPFQTPEGLSPYFQSLYTIDVMQHQFPYYNIQSLDNWQRPRVAPTLRPMNRPLFSRHARQHPAADAANGNDQHPLSPGAGGLPRGFEHPGGSRTHRFKIVQRLGIAPKAGVTSPSKLEEITAAPDEKGDFALFEFTGALPRVKLYANWRVNTNDAATLQNPGPADSIPPRRFWSPPRPPGWPRSPPTKLRHGGIQNYAPTKVTLAASTPADAVLLWNDKYDPIGR